MALARWVRFPGAAAVLFLVLYGWVALTYTLAAAHRHSTLIVMLRFFAPFAFFTNEDGPGRVETWRGSPWFFLGWQLCLCAVAVIVALLRGADPGLLPRAFRTADSRLIHAAICCSRYSSWTCCGVRY